MVESLIDHTHCVHFNEKIFEIFLVGQAVYINEPNFKNLCYSILELLNVFEDSVQCIHIL